MARSGSIVPLIILFVVVGILLAVGFVVYSIANEVAHQGKEQMERNNIPLSKDGMRVDVRSVNAEQEGDRTQSVLMKVWNNAASAAQKEESSWFNWGRSSSSSTAKRQPYSRTSSSQSAKLEKIPSNRVSR